MEDQIQSALVLKNQFMLLSKFRFIYAMPLYSTCNHITLLHRLYYVIFKIFFILRYSTMNQLD
ncbi:hypothetical protein MtrunA17_Chr3g0124521 [Medicago truncatula]|uniref:Uncharacterized protein n=1 Tax=Medicago truncatula TaxID=3880 RepID=A0A396IXP6_MEDTR|nr:hypothetical protein MtrunA17_Chr3g0124521 [Medicago truncatula]